MPGRSCAALVGGIHFVRGLTRLAIVARRTHRKHGDDRAERDDGDRNQPKRAPAVITRWRNAARRVRHAQHRLERREIEAIFRKVAPTLLACRLRLGRE